jgi:hypothetical protein
MPVSESSGPQLYLEPVLIAPFDFIEKDTFFRGIPSLEGYDQIDDQQQPDILALICPIVDGLDFLFDPCLPTQAYRSAFAEEDILVPYFQDG